jgi:diphthine synthase
MIGLGLYDEKDITVRGLEAVKSSEKVYLEMYTAILMVSKDRLEAFFEKPVVEADRMFVEAGCQEMIEEAKT